jgi:hypothetical protein
MQVRFRGHGESVHFLFDGEDRGRLPEIITFASVRDIQRTAMGTAEAAIPPQALQRYYSPSLSKKRQMVSIPR